MTTQENNLHSEISVAILCDGRRARLREKTEAIPKPFIGVGDRLILWHILNLFSTQGFRKNEWARGSAPRKMWKV